MLYVFFRKLKKSDSKNNYRTGELGTRSSGAEEEAVGKFHKTPPYENPFPALEAVGSRSGSCSLSVTLFSGVVKSSLFPSLPTT
jgi:hypothetical protein